MSDLLKKSTEVRVAERADENIDLANLTNEFVQIVAQLSRANQLLAEAEELCEHTEHLLEVEEARLSIRYRDILKSKGEKPTERLIDDYVKCDINRINLCTKVISARAYKQSCRRIVETLDKKSSILISLGAHIRAEMTFDSSIPRGKK